MDENRKKALELALLGIEKQYGKGAVMRLDAEARRPPPTCRSSRRARSRWTSRWARGLSPGAHRRDLRAGELGQDHAHAARHRRGAEARAAWRPSSTPSTRSTSTTPALGVKVDELLVSQPDNGEQALEIADMLVRSGAVDIVVIDSVAALVPKAEIEGEMGDQLPGLQARLMSQALRKLTASVHRSSTLLVFINQIRMKIGVMFGNPETTTGGNALKFYASMRLDVRRVGALKNGETGGGQPHPREGGEEQARGALPRGGVRHPVRPGHLEDAATCSTLQARDGIVEKSRRVVLVQGRAHRSGPRGGEDLPRRAPRTCSTASRPRCWPSTASCAWPARGGQGRGEGRARLPQGAAQGPGLRAPPWARSGRARGGCRAS
jgi:RecA/RadA recombinase